MLELKDKMKLKDEIKRRLVDVKTKDKIKDENKEVVSSLHSVLNFNLKKP